MSLPRAFLFTLLVSVTMLACSLSVDVAGPDSNKPEPTSIAAAVNATLTVHAGPTSIAEAVNATLTAVASRQVSAPQPILPATVTQVAQAIATVMAIPSATLQPSPLPTVTPPAPPPDTPTRPPTVVSLGPTSKPVIATPIIIVVTATPRPVVVASTPIVIVVAAAPQPTSIPPATASATLTNTPIPTNTPVPTNTPLPTATWTPSNTPTFTPSATPTSTRTPTNTLTPTPTRTFTPFPPPRCGQTYCVLRTRCDPGENTRVIGTVYENSVPKNGVRVRVSYAYGGDPVIDDYISGRDPNNPSVYNPNRPGYYQLGIKEGGQLAGNWWVFIMSNDGKTVLSEGHLFNTQDQLTSTSCQVGVTDFYR